MEFKQHVGVLNVDGQEIGRLERVVIDPESNEVTHLVIRQGLLAVRDKVLPLSRVEVGTEDGIVVRLTLDEFEQLPDFEETQTVAADEVRAGHAGQTDAARSVPVIYWPLMYPHSPLLPQLSEPYRVETQLNIPAGTVAVKDGATVIARDGKPVGSVCEVLTTGEDERVTHVLISHGRLVKEKKLIPFSWIEMLGENEVYLAVGSGLLDKLPDYDHA
jgi:sporulation protein YlmC with PRC-barrel domain